MPRGNPGAKEPAGTTPVPSRKRLSAFDGSSEGQRVAEIEARLAGDTELVTRLMFAGYEGPDWLEVADRLAAYGLRVITSWIIDGTIASKCKEKGWAGPWSSRCRHPCEAQELAADTVADALFKFRDNVLIPGRWRPDRGASLSTFFIGQCLLRWANVFNKWTRETRHIPDADLGRFERSDESAQHSRVLDSFEVESLLKLADAQTERVVRLRAEGYEWDEIAILTGSAVTKLRGLYFRFQERARKTREAL